MVIYFVNKMIYGVKILSSLESTSPNCYFGKKLNTQCVLAIKHGFEICSLIIK